MYRRLRAPRNDGELLLAPSGPECLSLPKKNRALLATYDFNLDGNSIQSLRTSARRHLLASARRYTSEYCSTLASTTDDQLILMSGHQPTLFHPGVWAKNFATYRLAKRVGGIAIHVIIDNDTMREHFIRIPTGSVTSPETTAEPFDQFSDPIPFENRQVEDLSLLESFPTRVRNHITSFVARPLVGVIWKDVMSAVRNGKPLGHAFAQARHQLEQSWGLQTLEVPLSLLCESTVFRQFAAHLLLRGMEVRHAYNQRLAEYRRVHRLRSPAQPLPDLRIDGEWCETPFWFWTANTLQRRALWCRRQGDDVQIGDADSLCWTLSNAARSPEAAIEQLEVLCEANLRLRPRALTNTMFLRLFLCDCFVHGIGGAKYDQITELLIHDLFGIDPPELISLSQTTLLPAATNLARESEFVEERQVLREMYFHPEKFIDPEVRSGSQVSSLEKTKYKLIALDPPRGQRSQRHREIESVNAQLRRFLQGKAENQEKLLAELRQRISASEVLATREWSFCLFPESFLKTRLLDLKFARH